jgi:hypothetical protein
MVGSALLTHHTKSPDSLNQGFFGDGQGEIRTLDTP